MKCIRSDISKHVMIAVVGLSLLLQTSTALSAQVAGKKSVNKTLPGQTSTQTAPLPSTTQTVPVPSTTREYQRVVPSTTREYQQVDKPPVKKLDIPNIDIAGQLKIVGFAYKRKTAVTIFYPKPIFHPTRFRGIKFQISLMNKGKLNVTRNVPIRVRVLNAQNQTLIKEENHLLRNVNIRNDYFTTTPVIVINFRLDVNGAPSTINDVKLIVDVDPNNTFREARRHRGNNRCVVTW